MQKIETLKIKNHLFFEDCILEFKKYNFLIGVNLTGKSLFLKSLQDNSLLDIPSSQWKGDKNNKNIFLINNLSRDLFYTKDKTFGYIDVSPLSERKKNVGADGFTPKDQIYLSEVDEKGHAVPFTKNQSVLLKLANFSYLRDKDIISSFPLQKNNNVSTPYSAGQNMAIMLRLKILEYEHQRDIFIIDEPEANIHPIAQLNYIVKLTEDTKNQFLISTHSPFLIKEHIFNNDSKIFVFKKTRSGKTEIIDIKNDKLPKWVSSYGAINWYALNYPTEEFHNELYGILQELSECWTEKQFEKYLSETLCTQKNKSWIKIYKGKTQEPYSTSLSTYIRNSIHHPENEKNRKFTKEELIESIEFMAENISKIK
jgi:hypothetical protein